MSRHSLYCHDKERRNLFPAQEEVSRCVNALAGISTRRDSLRSRPILLFVVGWLISETRREATVSSSTSSKEEWGEVAMA
jgi:hypothetical protein